MFSPKCKNSMDFEQSATSPEMSPFFVKNKRTKCSLDDNTDNYDDLNFKSPNLSPI